ncbi:anaerobic sulfatase maturase [Photobacterium sp. DNB23_23_1]|uniref:Anaerobic sulfatase maturase n=1 Tax=Photobacterium pectinilyticum TaxID=2906793 RepID=A0ABT1N2L2_9GAMM|nr:anaerobic sulfatase maturase [Photobacterium sp. ZSDE20]MCQ1058983.1 anaerobic sulfatase maturase [Photobacterium sp. ZSDE20]MDD1824002.1 anaerobic sulfatase maturase [Photobacterium sp. ZSDE20]
MPQNRSNKTVPESKVAQGIHVVSKPIGPVCNIKCEYCFYLEKHALYPKNEHYRISDEVLAAFIKQYVESQPTPVVEFLWQGGEPTLLGMDFYKKVVELQAPYKQQKEIRNSLQTNGIRLDDDWCKFFKANNFFIGISLDGPKDIHDRYRKDRRGEGTFERVMQGVRLLKKHQVEFNVLACVGRETASRPLDVYHFFKEEGIEYIQFSPIVEREPNQETSAQGLWLASPATLERLEPNTEVTPWTVDPKQYGEFLIAIYEEWVRQDVGTTFVMNFEWALTAWMGEPSPVCIFSRQCGRAVAMEHDGSLFSCDHYVYPDYRLGNILSDELGQMVEQSVLKGFGPHKEHTLPRWCRECDVLNACWGGCPKHRFITSPDGEPGLHYLCAGYQAFFRHIRKYLRAMATLLNNDLPVSYVMEAVKGPLVIKKTGDISRQSRESE